MAAAAMMTTAQFVAVPIPNVGAATPVVSPALVLGDRAGCAVALARIDPKNKAAKLHVDRCMLFQHRFSDVLNWDGVWNLTEK